jgi:hypothetical protein
LAIRCSNQNEFSMSVLTFRALRRRALCGSAIVALLGFADAAAAQPGFRSSSSGRRRRKKNLAQTGAGLQPPRSAATVKLR